jgi:phage terminase large subunit-like protein
VDPAVTNNAGSDETGIVVVGLGADGRGYVLADLSGRMSPLEWAKRAVDAYQKFGADRIVAEVNNGGALVEINLRTVSHNVPYKGVHASQGKRTRAEPISALYEQGRVSHVGLFQKLEDQMCTWEPLTGMHSPDRLDALVWGLSEVMPLGPSVQRNLVNLPYA